MGIKNVHLMAIGVLDEAVVNKNHPSTKLEPCSFIYARTDTHMINNNISYHASQLMDATRSSDLLSYFTALIGVDSVATGCTNIVKPAAHTDDEMVKQTQRIEAIKHPPNRFHLEFFDANNMYNIVGGAPAFAFAAVGATITYGYYAGFAATGHLNFCAHNMRVASRLVMGFSLGMAVGYQRFGDRQKGSDSGGNSGNWLIIYIGVA